jgi:hypothetical protein
MQVDLDMHKHRVHHNCKIDTACFEEGKRWSHRSVLRVGSTSLTIRRRNTRTRLVAQLENIRLWIDVKHPLLMTRSLEAKRFCSELPRSSGLNSPGHWARHVGFLGCTRKFLLNQCTAGHDAEENLGRGARAKTRRSSFMADVSVAAFQKLNGGVADDASPVAGGVA